MKGLCTLCTNVPFSYWISPTYLKKSEAIKTCDINISDSESQGGAFCITGVDSTENNVICV
jgi:hypothetical protein